jgi:hypothetical protein
MPVCFRVIEARLSQGPVNGGQTGRHQLGNWHRLRSADPGDRAQAEVPATQLPVMGDFNQNQFRRTDGRCP